MTTATYNIEDNKIRIFFDGKPSPNMLKKLHEVKMGYAPVQGCWYGVWNTAREDLALEVAGEIVPDDKTLADRAADRHERLMTAAKQNNQRYDALTDKAMAVSIFSKQGDTLMQRAQYAKERANELARNAEGALWHASYKNADSTRKNRIKGLYKELRDCYEFRNRMYECWQKWEAIARIEDKNDRDEAVKHSVGLLNMSPSINMKLYEKVRTGVLAPDEALQQAIAAFSNTFKGKPYHRTIAHLLMRLAYEQGELGTAPYFSDKLTPVIIQAFMRHHGALKPKAVKTTDGCSVTCEAPIPDHLFEGLTLTLTDDEWRYLFQEHHYIP